MDRVRRRKDLGSSTATTDAWHEEEAGGRAGERSKRTANAESRSEAAAKWKRPARELAQGNRRGTWSEGVWRPGKMGGTKEAEAVQQ